MVLFRFSRLPSGAGGKRAAILSLKWRGSHIRPHAGRMPLRMPYGRIYEPTRQWRDNNMTKRQRDAPQLAFLPPRTPQPIH